MTAQIMETLYIDGTKQYMAAEPFGDYLGKLEQPPEFIANNTGYWRGYMGKWKIKDDKLFLTGLLAAVSSPPGSGRPYIRLDKMVQ